MGASASLCAMIEDMDVMTAGQRLARRWERAGIRQAPLALRAGVSVRVLQHMKKGRDRNVDMTGSIAKVERALAEMLSELPPEPEEQAQTTQRRLRAVEAYVRDEEDVVGVTAREVRPGMRTVTLVLLDSDRPMDDETRDQLLRLLDEAQQTGDLSP